MNKKTKFEYVAPYGREVATLRALTDEISAPSKHDLSVRERIMAVAAFLVDEDDDDDETPSPAVARYLKDIDARARKHGAAA
jgi:hypothetical protein